MDRWEPTDEQQRGWEEQGYFVARGVISREAAIECRGVIKDTILKPDPGTRADADPMDPMGDSPAARIARFRKLANFCVSSPLIWHTVHAGDLLPRMARHYLGDDVLLKFNSCFLKPARTGSATPWHQDNGLWRDGETEPFNAWIALDPATRANGCLQFIPGSHRTEIVEHVLYENSIHGELPRERVVAMIESDGVEHIELEPGDAVCWHSSLWHYSPPNTSEQGRIAVAAVYTSVALADSRNRWRRFPWILRGGELVTAFPPEEYVVGDGQMEPFPPFPKVGEVAVS